MVIWKGLYLVVWYVRSPVPARAGDVPGEVAVEAPEGGGGGGQGQQHHRRLHEDFTTMMEIAGELFNFVPHA